MTTIIDSTSGTIQDLDGDLAKKHAELLKCIAINEALQDRMAAEAARYEKRIVELEEQLRDNVWRPVGPDQRPLGKPPRQGQSVYLLVLAKYDKPIADDDNLIWWAKNEIDGDYVKAGVLGWRTTI